MCRQGLWGDHAKVGVLISITQLALTDANSTPARPRVVGGSASEHSAPSETPMTDFRTADHGSVILIWPVSDAAHQWVEENVIAEPWQWFGGALGVDHRFARDLIDGIAAAGFQISS